MKQNGMRLLPYGIILGIDFYLLPLLMKNTGANSGRYLRSWRSDLRSVRISLSRPIIGHTPRKLPPVGAISRFIADQRGKIRPSRADLLIIKENPPIVKRIFSVFHEK